MSIQRTDIDYFKSETVDNTSSNGGRVSANESLSGITNNIFPTVSQAERTAGSTTHRKIFVKNSESTGLILENPTVFIENPTPADDHVFMFAGTQTDTEGDLSGSERPYGSGWLNVSVSSGVTTIDVRVEDGVNYKIFENGDTIRISDKADIDATGNEEVVTINAVVSWATDVATISFTPALQNAYSSTSDATRVSSIISMSNIGAAIEGSITKTSTGGNFDDVNFPILLDNRGAIQQTWTLTFTDSNNFNITGDTLSGILGTGTASGGASLINAGFGQPYFTIPVGFFTGSWAASETLVFTTKPSAYPLWFKRVVPAGISSQSGNKFVIAVEGESA